MKLGTKWSLLRSVPIMLTGLRVLLAPVVVLLSLFVPLPQAFAVCLVVAFLSDIFDGVLARRFGIATANLRRLDSVADTLFYAACVFAAWHLYPTAITQHLGALAVLGTLEVMRYSLDFLKFRREASYHMWSSKVWGIALFAGFFGLLVMGSSGAVVSCAIYLGIVADVEGLLISLVLPRWQADVPSLVHALKMRQVHAAAVRMHQGRCSNAMRVGGLRVMCCEGGRLRYGRRCRQGKIFHHSPRRHRSLLGRLHPGDILARWVVRRKIQFIQIAGYHFSLRRSLDRPEMSALGMRRPQDDNHLNNQKHGPLRMGKPDALDHLVQIMIVLTALFCLANGGFMVWNPHGWYQMLPTVQATGSYNQHFIRDIGLAYFTTGVVLGYAARFPSGRWLAAFAGALWLTAHGAFHVWELLSGIGAQHVFWMDAPGVLGPPLLVWIALGILMARQRIAPAGIPKSMFLRVIDKLSPGESAYFHEVSKAPGHALEKLAHFMPATMHRYAAPVDLFHMTRIGATLIEDCGACALTAARVALNDGVPKVLINAALASKTLDGDRQTAFDFGQAIARQAADASSLGDAIQTRYGRTVRLELAMTAATVRAYPGMKRGLGLSTSCSVTKLEL